MKLQSLLLGLYLIFSSASSLANQFDPVAAFKNGDDETVRSLFLNFDEAKTKVLEEVLVPNRVPLEDFIRFIELGGWRPIMINRVYEVATLPAIQHIIDNKNDLLSNLPSDIDLNTWEAPAFTIFKNYSKFKEEEVILAAYKSLPPQWINVNNQYPKSYSFLRTGKTMKLSPLHLAIHFKLANVVDLMLSSCVKPTAVSVGGNLAYDWAKKPEYKKVFKPIFKKWKKACRY